MNEEINDDTQTSLALGVSNDSAITDYRKDIRDIPTEVFTNENMSETDLASALGVVDPQHSPYSLIPIKSTRQIYASNGEIVKFALVDTEVLSILLRFCGRNGWQVGYDMYSNSLRAPRFTMVQRELSQSTGRVVARSFNFHMHRVVWYLNHLRSTRREFIGRSLDLVASYVLLDKVRAFEEMRFLDKLTFINGKCLDCRIANLENVTNYASTPAEVVVNITNRELNTMARAKVLRPATLGRSYSPAQHVTNALTNTLTSDSVHEQTTVEALGSSETQSIELKVLQLLTRSLSGFLHEYITTNTRPRLHEIAELSSITQLQILYAHKNMSLDYIESEIAVMSLLHNDLPKLLQQLQHRCTMGQLKDILTNAKTSPDVGLHDRLCQLIKLRLNTDDYNILSQP